MYSSEQIFISILVYLVIFGIVILPYSVFTYWLFGKLKFKENKYVKSLLFISLLLAVTLIPSIIVRTADLQDVAPLKVVLNVIQLIIIFAALKLIFKESNKKTLLGCIFTILAPIILALLLLPIFLFA